MSSLVRLSGLSFSLSIWLCPNSWAQPDGLFLPCGEGIYNNVVSTFFEDTLTDELYLGGTFIGARDSSAWSPSILRWDGQAYHTVGCGFEWNCVNPLSPNGLAPAVLTITRWNGDLYAGGQFNSAAGVTVDHIARFDGNAWQPVGGGTDGTVVSLRPHADGLYATGWFSQAGGVVARGLARWDGSEWHSVYDLPNWSDPNAIFDMSFYQGDLYVGGNFGAPGGIRDIARYNGSEWVGCQEGFIGQTSGVYQFETHDNLLYVAGYLADWQPYGPESNPGSGVVTWNGSEWGRLGTGTRYSSNPTVYKMAWLRDTLYVGGIFTTIDGMPTGGLARWDGQDWCSLVPPDYFGSSWQRVGVFRDTLYVGGSFVTGGNDTLNRIAKWTGGWVDTCSVAVGWEEPEPRGTGLVRVYPNPVQATLSIADIPERYGPLRLRVADALGRTVIDQPFRRGPFAVGKLVAGVYQLTLRDGNDRPVAVGRFVKE